MSRREKLLKQDLVAHIRKDRGSFKKLSDYSRIMHRFAERLAKLNIQISSAAQVKVRHIELYMNSRSDVSKRTRENEMSAIRVMLRQAGKHKMADPEHPRLSNKALGISGGSRKGTKKLITDERFREILQRVEAKDKGVAAVVKLNRPGFPGECFICELRLPDQYFRWKHNKLFLLLPDEYDPAFPAIVDCYTSPPTLVWPVPLLSGFSNSYGVLPPLCKDH